MICKLQAVSKGQDVQVRPERAVLNLGQDTLYQKVFPIVQSAGIEGDEAKLVKSRDACSAAVLLVLGDQPAQRCRWRRRACTV